MFILLYFTNSADDTRCHDNKGQNTGSHTLLVYSHHPPPCACSIINSRCIYGCFGRTVRKPLFTRSQVGEMLRQLVLSVRTNCKRKKKTAASVSKGTGHRSTTTPRPHTYGSYLSTFNSRHILHISLASNQIPPTDHWQYSTNILKAELDKKIRRLGTCSSTSYTSGLTVTARFLLHGSFAVVWCRPAQPRT